MSIQAVAWALEQDLPQGPKLVLVSIANHADHTNGYCWLSAEKISEEASCSPRSVWRYVGGLVRNGYIRKAPRKGEHGKQRANDYWLMMARERKAWDWTAQLEYAAEDEAEAEPLAADESASHASGDELAPQHVVEPYAKLAHGETVDNSVPDPVDTPHLAHGPCATAVTRKSLIEPSESKPKKDARAREGPYVPRAYRPPPPSPSEPQGAVIADREAKQIFVFEGTRAWEAWVAFKSRERGVRWHLTTTAIIDGKSKTGWWFPSLFPKLPDEPKADPPESLASESELREFSKAG